MQKIDLLMDFAAGVYLSEDQNLIHRLPPPPYTTYSTRVYSILFHTGKGMGGRVEPERRLERQQFTKLGRKYKHDWLYLQSINSDKHLPQSHFTGQFF